MPMPDFAYLYLHRNSRTDNLCNIKALHKLMAEQEKGLRHETPSVRDLLMRNTPVMVNGLFASPYYTAVMTDYYLNDSDPAPFKRIFARKSVMYWGFVRDMDGMLYINNTKCVEDIKDKRWMPLKEKF